MSDTEDNNPLAERLGAQRLSAPGVLSRSALESRYDTLTRNATPNGLVEKLHRRSAFSSNTGGSFVWSQTRGAQSMGSEPMPIVSATPAQAPVSVIQRKPIASASPDPSPVRTPDLSHTVWGEVTKGEVVKGEVSPSSLTLTPTPSPRTARERVGVRGNEQSSPASSSASAPASPISSPAAPAMIMRKESPGAPQVPPQFSSSPISGSPSSPAAQQPSSPTTSRSPDRPAAPVIAPAISRTPLLTVLARKPSSDTPSFLSRSVSAPLVPAYRSAPTISARTPSSSTGAASMLMRRLEDPRPPNTPQFGAPPLAPPRHSDQVAHEETKAAPTGPSEGAVESYGHHADNDALADQVSQRILRRLEIERERRGERSWR